MTYLLSIIGILAVLLLLATIRDYQRRGGLPYPPGPRPLPLLGNYLDIPQQFPWLTFSKFSKNYGSHTHTVWQKFSSDVNIREYLVLPNVWAGYRRIEHCRGRQGSP